ncbi:TetR/AcrR family transcriptional regulator [Streptomyces sp. NPDC127092]|uniref:TetR/AcrR family transcriptional regulator n=1 Tax=Streptomyces sp. NPDC127092 TaxID=3347135 RepID=UPI0036488183
MPKLWNETIEAHRSAVRDATLDATAALVAEHGLMSVTMSRIAQETGIGRATLYKYFPDVESILVAWHERQVGHHLEQLEAARDRTTDPDRRLHVVLETYALMSHERHRHHGHHGAAMTALLHQGPVITQAHERLLELVRDLVAEGAASGALRSDVAPGELAAYCLHALGAAAGLPSKAAVRRLVTVTLAGLSADAHPVQETPAGMEDTLAHGRHGHRRHGSH